LEEPSPLGLRLKKSPSLVDLIQMKLVQAGKAKDAQHGGTASASEKLKASNFPGSVLRIGSWEWVSRYEGDLVVKCYFAKHKLVWEVLDGGLKSKIEIQWSDICALKVVCPETEPGTLEIALSRQPLFFRETNPQPRKHTLWQATSDFTAGQVG
uniref:TRF2/HOY1 PH-like domain-containing protein n=1 Tax=Aegilops tauschii subsp. strangulata TaxID=200361 RepID=A0A453KGX9_AEGTS